MENLFNCVAVKLVLEKPVERIVVQITHVSTTSAGKLNQSSSIMCTGLMKYSVSVWVSTEMQVLVLYWFWKIKCPWCLVLVSSQCVQAAVTLMSTRVRQVSDGGLHLQSQEYQQRGDLALTSTDLHHHPPACKTTSDLVGDGFVLWTQLQNLPSRGQQSVPSVSGDGKGTIGRISLNIVVSVVTPPRGDMLELHIIGTQGSPTTADDYQIVIWYVFKNMHLFYFVYCLF